mmetsp:Transcript_29998/g.45865  ORF Transcript_29998/g.45865 Transcript_29998/m.45865 type:complete len:148 (-) Transcript_29998:165-608(-)
MLKEMVGVNISERENIYNRETAHQEGIPDDKFTVVADSFDHLSFDPASFDLIFSNESILYSDDKKALMKNTADLVKWGGLVLYTDILENPSVPKEALTEVYGRLDLDGLGTKDLYDSTLQANGLTPIASFFGYKEPRQTLRLRPQRR